MARSALRPDPAWHERLGGGLRKQPVQERSRTMVEHVLDTAGELVQDLGYEAVVGSPSLLLEKSGVSRGSFYAFFETPESVLDELCYRQMIDATGKIQQQLNARRGKNWTEIVDVVVGYYTEEHRIPMIRELWVRQNLTERVRALDELCIDDWAGRLLTEFRKHEPQFADLTRLHCSVALHAIERLFQFAFAEDENGDPEIVAQARFLLMQYFAGHAEA